MKQIEVFGLPGDYALGQLGKNEPNIWNGEVSVKRYRITVEEIDEPVEVLKERLQALLNQRGHIDNAKAVRAEAERLGIIGWSPRRLYEEVERLRNKLAATRRMIELDPCSTARKTLAIIDSNPIPSEGIAHG